MDASAKMDGDVLRHARIDRGHRLARSLQGPESGGGGRAVVRIISGNRIDVEVRGCGCHGAAAKCERQQEADERMEPGSYFHELLRICIMREAPERAIGTDRPACRSLRRRLEGGEMGVAFSYGVEACVIKGFWFRELTPPPFRARRRQSRAGEPDRDSRLQHAGDSDRIGIASPGPCRPPSRLC